MAFLPALPYRSACISVGGSCIKPGKSLHEAQSELQSPHWAGWSCAASLSGLDEEIGYLCEYKNLDVKDRRGWQGILYRVALDADILEDPSSPKQGNNTILENKYVQVSSRELGKLIKSAAFYPSVGS